MNAAHFQPISPPASVTGQAASRPSPLHPYACVRCRQRKVKCDKIAAGCAHCREIGAQCAYLARRPRKAQKLLQPDSGAPRPLRPAQRGSDSSEAARHSRPSHPAPDSRDETRSSDEDGGDGNDEQDDVEEDVLIPHEMQDSIFRGPLDSHQSGHGRLVVSQGKSRYINSDKADQVANLQMVLTASTGIEDVASTDPPRRALARPDDDRDKNTLLRMPSTKQCLRAYQPNPMDMGVMWNYYCRNVDVLVKVLYKPEVEALIDRASRDLGAVTQSSEPLLFAIWFAAVTTMSADECLQLHGGNRATLLRKYKYALETALAQAGWMTAQEIVVLQALNLYIVFAPGKDMRSTWMLSGIALGAAQAMGLHSDSAFSTASLIETEVRRRVWWSLCQLDNRISEDCGLEPHAPLVMDIKLPLHVDDSDLSIHSEETISPKTQFTEMTATLVKMEMADASIKFKRSRLRSPPPSNADMESMVREHIDRLESTYMQYYGSSYLQRVCYLGTRLVIAKLWKMLYDVSQHKSDAGSDELQEPLLLYNADIVEISHELLGRLTQFGWFFRCQYTQWNAMAYLLARLRKHTEGAAVDRAWTVLDTAFADPRSGGGSPDRHSNMDAANLQRAGKKHVLWQSLRRVYMRVRQAREQTLQAQRAASEGTLTTDSGYDTSGVTSTEPQALPPTPPPEVLLGDPFLGAGYDFGEDMNWDQFQAWFSSLQPDILAPQGMMDIQEDNLTEALGWQEYPR